MGDRNRRRNSRKRVGTVLGLALLCGLTGAVFCGAHPALAETGEQEPRIKLPSGQITAIKGDTIEIDGKDYSLKEDVKITDDRGNPLERADLAVNLEVKFRVARERIVRLIVVYPR